MIERKPSLWWLVIPLVGALVLAAWDSDDSPVSPDKPAPSEPAKPAPTKPKRP